MHADRMNATCNAWTGRETCLCLCFPWSMDFGRRWLPLGTIAVAVSVVEVQSFKKQRVK